MKFDKAGVALATISASFLILGTIIAVHTRLPLTGSLIENTALAAIDAGVAFWLFRKSKTVPVDRRWRYNAAAILFAVACIFVITLHVFKSI